MQVSLCGQIRFPLERVGRNWYFRVQSFHKILCGKKFLDKQAKVPLFSFDCVLTYVCKAKCRYLAQMQKFRRLWPQPKAVLKFHIQRHLCRSPCSEIGVQAPTTGTEHLEITKIVGQDTATCLASPASEGCRCAVIPMSSCVGSHLTYFKLSQITLVLSIQATEFTSESAFFFDSKEILSTKHTYRYLHLGSLMWKPIPVLLTEIRKG